MKVRQLLLLLICFQSTAQNLVPNPSFEEYIRCPRLPAIAHKILSEKIGTPVPPARPTIIIVAAKTNAACRIIGQASPRLIRKGYAGIFMWTANSEYGEYLQCE